MEKLLTIKEVAAILSVAEGTVYGWLSKGVDLPAIKIRGTVRFREKAVSDWILAKETAKRKRDFEL